VNELEAIAAGNGSGSETWARSWTHFRVDRRSRGYCRVTFDHPPANAVTATTVAELAELIELIETDPDLEVVVFDSADPDHYLGTGPTAAPAWSDLVARLERAPVVSIASIRGRASGAGVELIRACDLRFASRERALIGELDVGVGGVPGRALEILAVADDELDAEVEAIAVRLGRCETLSDT
jgi:enoyl-CoA hydratase/carnithine racemase